MTRKKQSKSRDQAANLGDQVSSDADEVGAIADVAATGRDAAASDREAVSAARDAAADARDVAAEELELAAGPGDAVYEAAVQQAAELRGHAAADRRESAIDRAHAATDRRQAVLELERSHKDDLTGAYRRGAGRTMLQREIDRAKRSGQPLVLAFVDLDGLKLTNDRDGHEAGDARLRDVVSAMRSKIRNYEPIVRYGGDEFICSFSGVETMVVRSRFDEIGAVLAERDDAGSISVGLAELRDGDSLQDLVNRADQALTEASRD